MLNVLKSDGIPVMAVDPGKTTGVAIGIPTGMEYSNWSFDLVHIEDVTWDERHKVFDYICMMQSRGMDFRVVVESFNLYPGAAHGQAAIRSDFPSIRIIGLVDATRAPFELQAPAVKKRVTVLAVHKPLLRGTSQHIKDAYKHLRYYIVGQGAALTNADTT